jgi:hypothetical protein
MMLRWTVNRIAYWLLIAMLAFAGIAFLAWMLL